MLDKHTQELANLDLNEAATAVEPDEKEDKNEVPAKDQKISKAQKRRDKKALAEQERERMIRAGEEENKFGPRNQELKAINKILNSRGLQLFNIPSDGDCLYNSIKHQLELNGYPNYEVPKLRELTSNYITNNKDSLICFMTSPETDEMLNDEEFTKYCEAVRNTKAWGGQIEIMALSNELKCKIEVIQSTGSPTIQGNEFSGPPLVLSFHKHLFALGEHYNSTAPYIENDGESEDNEN